MKWVALLCCTGLALVARLAPRYLTFSQDPLTAGVKFARGLSRYYVCEGHNYSSPTFPATDDKLTQKSIHREQQTQLRLCGHGAALWLNYWTICWRFVGSNRRSDRSLLPSLGLSVGGLGVWSFSSVQFKMARSASQSFSSVQFKMAQSMSQSFSSVQFSLVQDGMIYEPVLQFSSRWHGSRASPSVQFKMTWSTN